MTAHFHQPHQKQTYRKRFKRLVNDEAFDDVRQHRLDDSLLALGDLDATARGVKDAAHWRRVDGDVVFTQQAGPTTETQTLTDRAYDRNPKANRPGLRQEPKQTGRAYDKNLNS